MPPHIPVSHRRDDQGALTVGIGNRVRHDLAESASAQAQVDDVRAIIGRRIPIRIDRVVDPRSDIADEPIDHPGSAP